ncbi:hypothetical protein GGR51DRAFT_561903 [Nemania sp. FL0031]|nr:hypothetical protein GGR51DRAFT_561903 [Nemania sp. FL0031]
MGSEHFARGVTAVRFSGRYYVDVHDYDSGYSWLGARIISAIPTDPARYKEWLEKKRAKYARYQEDADNYSQVSEAAYCETSYWPRGRRPIFPTEFPKLSQYYAQYVYIINLDREVFTVNYGAHWKLGNIPRRNDLWHKAIVNSIFQNENTISLEECLEDHIGAPALELPEPNSNIRYDHSSINPKRDIIEPRKAFLTYVLAKTVVQYKKEILQFGAEWSTNSFPFRELAFALISIAHGQSGFQSSPTTQPGLKRIPPSPIWINVGQIGNKVPLLEFGSMGHAPGKSPGVSPAETMYWFDGVLVSLVLVADGEAITQAVAWGIEQGRRSFQIIVLTLFEVVFAEFDPREEVPPVPPLRVSNAVPLSPLRIDNCMSTHPRNRPERREGMRTGLHRGELPERYMGTRKKLQTYFPGLASLVNFLDVAARRSAASKTWGVFPPEIYGKILEHADYDTWKACLSVSTVIRDYCLEKYRLDDRRIVVGGPSTKTLSDSTDFYMTFDFENLQTGQIVVAAIRSPGYPVELDSMPIVGWEQKAIMLNVRLRFNSTEDI